MLFYPLEREKSQKNKGAAGIDRETIEQVSSKSEQAIEELQRQLQQKRYEPQAVKKVMIPKDDGRQRPLGIPTVRDRVVQQAIQNKIEPIYERTFCEESYGYRPGKSAHQALDKVIEGIKEGNDYIVEVDIKGYFDNINHDRLMVLLNEHLADGTVLDLIESYLKVEVVDEQGKRARATKGTPQGGVLSPLLGNIYLNVLDKRLKKHNKKWVRYADDIIGLAKTQEEAEALKTLIVETLTELGLEVNEAKTKVVHKEEGFEFLGYEIREYEKKNGEKKLMRLIKAKNKKRFKKEVKKRTRRQAPVNIQQLLQELNPLLRGFGNYFKQVNVLSQMRELDSWVRMRLRCFLHKKKSKLDNFKYPNAYFANLGLVSLESIRHEYSLQ